VKNQSPIIPGVAGPCTIGHYCPSGSATEIDCPPGKYCGGPNLATFSGDCNAGYYCISRATTSTPTVLATHGGAICPTGFYCPVGSAAAIPCPAGTF
jgi:hypothetical protein